ncbi:uncharacterized protein MONOS_9871 [Monocercomonoides exilis]|uniref:uncharacterized protein n=1 Tax=Monocercomonoides exilis TaxID=2049356 RepID=UPI00355A7068|nr:hypothetical protein MONOS_9871 [Monocercomonoides exilis]|eukprot:MONOS_9871.1-p1 / transcript=MONOS_9871.1 / gene=MONOS_9871 / organism=Monocercomonoides_exilis_PA203 / gene_product=unspecified product / transcript_product=unspecified product / location=Mono_scaffold00423:42116-42826(-) / protein_length=98 / sequence_SO=supercontig / SO=protein_coding / is_pseudo=false
MEMMRGAVGAPTTPLSPVVVGGGVVTLGVMGMKNFNREVTRAMQDKRGKWVICVEDAENARVCSSRREANKNAVGSDECTEERAEAEPGGVEKRKGG